MKARLQNKLLLTYIILITTPSLLIGSILYSNARIRLIESTVAHERTVSSVARFAVDSFLNGIKDKTVTLLDSPNLIPFLHTPGNNQLYENLLSDITRKNQRYSRYFISIRLLRETDEIIIPVDISLPHLPSTLPLQQTGAEKKLRFLSYQSCTCELSLIQPCEEIPLPQGTLVDSRLHITSLTNILNKFSLEEAATLFITDGKSALVCNNGKYYMLPVDSFIHQYFPEAMETFKKGLLNKTKQTFLKIAGGNSCYFTLDPIEEYGIFLGLFYDFGSLVITLNSMFMEASLVMALFVLLGSYIALFLSRKLSAPISALAEVAREIEKGNLKIRPQVTSDDEIGELALAILKMVRTLEKKEEDIREYIIQLKKVQAELIQQEKLSSIGKLATGISHELRNPLAAIKNSISFIRLKFEKSMDQKLEKHFRIINDEIERASDIIGSLLSYSRQAPLNIETFNINDVISYSISLLSSKLEEKKIKIELQSRTPLPLFSGDRNLLKQVFINILDNSIDAIQNREGKIIITVTPHLLSLEDLYVLMQVNGESSSKNDKITMESNSPVRRTTFVNCKLGHPAIKIEVEDNGCGIAEENIGKIFDPFFTTKSTGAGAGMGLSIVQNIIARHNGSISVKSKEGEGTTFTIILPASDEIVREENSGQ